MRCIFRSAKPTRGKKKREKREAEIESLRKKVKKDQELLDSYLLVNGGQAKTDYHEKLPSKRGWRILFGWILN